MTSGRRFGQNPNRSRRAAKYTPRERVLIVVCGIKTETQYIQYVARELRLSNIEIELDSSGYDPTRLVGRARELTASAEKEAKRSGAPERKFKSTWVVCDVDNEQSSLSQLLKSENSVRFAISNPCIEAWLLMHGPAPTSYLAIDEAQRQAKQNGYVVNDKTLVESKLTRLFSHAEGVAATLRKKHDGDGSPFPDNNPSSDVDHLVRYLITLAEGSVPGLEHSL